MFKRLLDPKAEKRPVSVLEVNKYLEDRWLAKLGAEKAMNGNDRSELSLSLLSPSLSSTSLTRRLHRWRRRKGRAMSLHVQFPQLSRGEESTASHSDHVRDRNNRGQSQEEGPNQGMDSSERDSRGVRGGRVGSKRGYPRRLRGRRRGAQLDEGQTFPRNSSSRQERRGQEAQKSNASRVIGQKKAAYQKTAYRTKDPICPSSSRGTRNRSQIRQFPQRRSQFGTSQEWNEQRHDASSISKNRAQYGNQSETIGERSNDQQFTDEQSERSRRIRSIQQRRKWFQA